MRKSYLMEHVVRRVCDKDPRCKAALALAGQRIQSFTCNILYESDGLNSDYDHVICGTETPNKKPRKVVLIMR